MGCNCGKKKIAIRQPKKIAKTPQVNEGSISSQTTTKRIIRRVSR